MQTGSQLHQGSSVFVTLNWVRICFYAKVWFDFMMRPQNDDIFLPFSIHQHLNFKIDHWHSDFEFCWWIIVWCCYSVVNFLGNPYKKHTMDHLLGRDMWGLLWIQTLMYLRLQSLQWCMQCHVILDVVLTHWGRVTHICVSKLTIIGSDNGLSPGRRQAIIWTSAGILIGSLGANFSEILIEIVTFSFKKMRFKVSSAKWRPFCLGLNGLMAQDCIIICRICVNWFTDPSSLYWESHLTQR